MTAVTKLDALYLFNEKLFIFLVDLSEYLEIVSEGSV